MTGMVLSFCVLTVLGWPDFVKELIWMCPRLVVLLFVISFAVSKVPSHFVCFVDGHHTLGQYMVGALGNRVLGLCLVGYIGYIGLYVNVGGFFALVVIIVFCSFCRCGVFIQVQIMVFCS